MRDCGILLRRVALSGGVLLMASSVCAGSGPTRELFLKLIDRPRVPLAPLVDPLDGGGDLAAFHFSFAADASQRVPGILFKAKSAHGRLPVVISLHGTGGNKDGQIPLLKELAGRGFLAVAIDGRYHGERTKAGKGSVEYNEAMLRTFRTGKEHPFVYDTVWDLMRLIDWLETRPDADGSRIGVIGFSKGGMEAYLAAAVDTRIRAVVPCIGVQSFEWALDNDSWHSRADTFRTALNGAAADAGVMPADAAFVRTFYDRVVPGIYSDFDGPRMLPLIAPRPLLVINGDSDPRTPQPGLRLCIEAARKAYAEAGAGDNFEFLLQKNTAHKVNPESLRHAVAWFERALGASDDKEPLSGQ